MADTINANDVLDLPVTWRKVNHGRWIAWLQGVECFLQMNNFPEEPLYTIKAGGIFLDIDDAPWAWTIQW